MRETQRQRQGGERKREIAGERDREREREGVRG